MDTDHSQSAGGLGNGDGSVDLQEPASTGHESQGGGEASEHALGDVSKAGGVEAGKPRVPEKNKKVIPRLPLAPPGLTLPIVSTIPGAPLIHQPNSTVVIQSPSNAIILPPKVVIPVGGTPGQPIDVRVGGYMCPTGQPTSNATPSMVASMPRAAIPPISVTSAASSSPVSMTSAQAPAEQKPAPFHPSRQSAKLHTLVHKPTQPRSREEQLRYETMAALQKNKQKEKPGPKPKIRKAGSPDESELDDLKESAKKKKRLDGREGDKEKELQRQDDTLAALAHKVASAQAADVHDQPHADH